ncbi:MAG: hypothetical protein C0501_03260 [Isosphaera sp.]|nr:hypothetical protein [Isosphaera sp.]
MRVTFCRRNFWGRASGGDELLFNYAKHLRAAGWEPSVLVGRPDEYPNPYRELLRAAGVSVAQVSRASPVVGAYRAARKLAGYVRRTTPEHERTRILRFGYGHALWRRPAVVHVVDLWQNLDVIPAARARGVPVLYQDIRAPRGEIKGSDLHNADLAAWYERLAGQLPDCAAVTALSPRLVRRFREQVGYRGPTFVIPPLVEDPVVASAPPERLGDGVTFGFAARRERLKGTLVLVDAFGELVRRRPGALLRLAGSPGDEEDVLARHPLIIGADPPVRVVPFGEGAGAKSSFFKGLDVFVLASLTEGTPMSIIEAMAHGLPVVATDVGGVADVVSEDVGVLVPPGNVSALADGLERLAADPGLRARMGRAARLRYERLFSPAAVLPVLLDVYRKLAGVPGGEPAAAAHPWAGPTT